MSRSGPGILLRDILSEKDAQVDAVIEVLNFADADILVLQNIDWDLELRALNALNERLKSPYPFLFAMRPNSGVASAIDLNLNGKFGEPGDSIGFGDFAGQDGMALLSRFAVKEERVIDFTNFEWRQLPGAQLDYNGGRHEEFKKATKTLPLSSTAHWVVPISIGTKTLTVLAHHATPPVFDGPEDLNGRRNADELLFWARYLNGDLGPTPAKSNMVMLSVTNLDPVDGDGLKQTFWHFKNTTNFLDPEPSSMGAKIEGSKDAHLGDASLDTVDWPNDNGPGNLRVNYALPTADLNVIGSGVLWPQETSSRLGKAVRAASRHRLVYLDIDF